MHSIFNYEHRPNLVENHRVVQVHQSFGRICICRSITRRACAGKVRCVVSKILRTKLAIVVFSPPTFFLPSLYMGCGVYLQHSILDDIFVIILRERQSAVTILVLPYQFSTQAFSALTSMIQTSWQTIGNYNSSQRSWAKIALLRRFKNTASVFHVESDYNKIKIHFLR